MYDIEEVGEAAKVADEVTEPKDAEAVVEAVGATALD